MIRVVLNLPLKRLGITGAGTLPEDNLEWGRANPQADVIKSQQGADHQIQIAVTALLHLFE